MRKITILLTFILIFLGCFCVLKFTQSSFSDTETVLGNSIQAGTWGTTAPEIPTPTGTITPSVTSVVINEVEYDTSQQQTDSEWEWFELYNNTSSSIGLSGWIVADNLNSDSIPDLTIPANGFAVIAASESGFMENYPSFSGLIVYISDRVIGNGLANGGDRLILKNENGNEIDSVSWLDDDYAFGTGNGVTPATGAGHSISRISNGVDTNSQNDWHKLINPSPGT